MAVRRARRGLALRHDQQAEAMLRRIVLWVGGRRRVRKVALSTPGIRDLAWRFVAGEDLPAGLDAIRALNQQGIKGTLNYVGTHVHDEVEAIAAADAIIEAVRSIHDQRLDSHVSIKLTQLGLDIDEALTRTNVRRVLARAAELDVFIRVDMEESRYVDQTIRLFEEMREAFGADRVGIVLQSYLRDRPNDLTRLLDAGSQIRLVKGGYWEPEAVVYRTREDIDRAFWRDLKLLLERGRHPAIATHDASAIEETRRLAEHSGLDRASYEFQMLYGVRPDLQADLVREGYAVRCYVPYGGQWFAYFLGCVRRMPGGAARRLRERIGNSRSGGRAGA
jgi:proline dehydrogenase